MICHAESALLPTIADEFSYTFPPQFSFFSCTFYFIAARTLNMSSTLLTNVLSAQYSIATYRHKVVQHISRMYSSCITDTLCLLISNSSFPLPQPLATTILLSEFLSLAILDSHVSGSSSICLSLSGLFHSASHPLGSSTASHMAGFPSFSRLNNIPLYVYVTFSLSIHPSMGMRYHLAFPLTLHLLAKRQMGLSFSLLPLENQDPDIQTQVPFPIKTNLGRFPGKYMRDDHHILSTHVPSYSGPSHTLCL